MPCAYCGSVATPTREHVIPRFLYKVGATGDPADGWNLIAMKRVAVSSQDGKWRPFYVRLSFLILPEEFSAVTVRVCTFGCLAFFLVIDQANQAKSFFRQYVKSILALWPNAMELSARRDRLVLKETQRTWGEEYLPMLEIEEAIQADLAGDRAS